MKMVPWKNGSGMTVQEIGIRAVCMSIRQMAAAGNHYPKQRHFMLKPDTILLEIEDENGKIAWSNPLLQANSIV